MLSDFFLYAGLTLSGVSFLFYLYRRQNSLAIAVSKGEHQAVKNILLTDSFDVDKRYRWGQTALMQAAYLGHDKVVQVLIDAKADLDVTNNFGDTALLKSIWYDQGKVARKLIHNGANVNIKNRYENSALFFSVQRGSWDIMQDLLRCTGIKVNVQDKWGTTPLIEAAQKGRLIFVTNLLHHGADPDILDNRGMSALDWAENECYMSVVAILKVYIANLAKIRSILKLSHKMHLSTATEIHAAIAKKVLSIRQNTSSKISLRYLEIITQPESSLLSPDEKRLLAFSIRKQHIKEKRSLVKRKSFRDIVSQEKSFNIPIDLWGQIALCLTYKDIGNLTRALRFK